MAKKTNTAIGQDRAVLQALGIIPEVGPIAAKVLGTVIDLFDDGPSPAPEDLRPMISVDAWFGPPAYWVTLRGQETYGHQYQVPGEPGWYGGTSADPASMPALCIFEWALPIFDTLAPDLLMIYMGSEQAAHDTLDDLYARSQYDVRGNLHVPLGDVWPPYHWPNAAPPGAKYPIYNSAPYAVQGYAGRYLGRRTDAAVFNGYLLGKAALNAGVNLANGPALTHGCVATGSRKTIDKMRDWYTNFPAPDCPDYLPAIVPDPPVGYMQYAQTWANQRSIAAAGIAQGADLIAWERPLSAQDAWEEDDGSGTIRVHFPHVRLWDTSWRMPATGGWSQRNNPAVQAYRPLMFPDQPLSVNQAQFLPWRWPAAPAQLAPWIEAINAETPVGIAGLSFSSIATGPALWGDRSAVARAWAHMDGRAQGLWDALLRTQAACYKLAPSFHLKPERAQQWSAERSAFKGIKPTELPMPIGAEIEALALAPTWTPRIARTAARRMTALVAWALDEKEAPGTVEAFTDEQWHYPAGDVKEQLALGMIMAYAAGQSLGVGVALDAGRPVLADVPIRVADDGTAVLAPVGGASSGSAAQAAQAAGAAAGGQPLAHPVDPDETDQSVRKKTKKKPETEIPWTAIGIGAAGLAAATAIALAARRK